MNHEQLKLLIDPVKRYICIDMLKDIIIKNA